MGSIILVILIAQVVSIVIIFFVLKKVLERRLFHFAIREFEFYSLPEGEENPKEIFIITCNNISDAYRQEIQKIAQKKFGIDVRSTFKIDKELMGGVVIKVNRTSYNFSLKERLRQSGFLR